jgi:beta-glucosidase
VAAVNPRTIVVLNTGSPVEMPWIDDVGAVVQAWFGGQAMGDALADVLVGDADPGGRLPVSFPVRYEDNPTAGDPAHYPGQNGQTHYDEGELVGYRYYSGVGTDPLFPFGHGLSYTTFSLGDPSVLAAGPDVTVEVPVTNTGDRPGSTVVQLYVRPPAAKVRRPDRELKAFAKVHLAPAATTTVRLTLDRRSFTHYDEEAAAWALTPGPHHLLVATSSTQIHHTLPLSIG